MKNLACNLLKNICIQLNIPSVSSGDDITEKINYLQWLNQKTTLIFCHNQINIPQSWIQSEITSFQYQYLKRYLSPDDMNIIDTYYIKKIYNNNEVYILDNTRIIAIDKKFRLAEILIFQKKHIVWVDFGYNIGSEFTGKHPALIVRNAGDNLIVIPLSSQPLDETKDYIVKVKKEHVYRLKKIDRWANVHRMMPISVKRIDFSSPHGDIKKEAYDEIVKAIKQQL